MGYDAQFLCSVGELLLFLGDDIFIMCSLPMEKVSSFAIVN